MFPASLIVHLAGTQNVWQLYVLDRISNGTVSLILGGVAPSSMPYRLCPIWDVANRPLGFAAFTGQINTLTEFQSQQFQHDDRRSNMLMHYTYYLSPSHDDGGDFDTEGNVSFIEERVGDRSTVIFGKNKEVRVLEAKWNCYPQAP